MVTGIPTYTYAETDIWHGGLETATDTFLTVHGLSIR